MLEITDKDIEALADDELRTLVGLLAEYEQRGAGQSALNARWGGDQKSKDGGVDVRVSAFGQARPDGFIPRPDTVFQVKKNNITAERIKAEMCPDQLLRQVVRALAHVAGAYVIVCGKSIASELIVPRVEAMEAVLDQNGLKGMIKVDFYDASTLATAVRGYPGLVIWVRQTVKRPIGNWQPALAVGQQSQASAYLCDDQPRVECPGHPAPLSVAQAVDSIRTALALPGSIVRLLGLPGTGKTRLAQALFEDGVGAQPLPAHRGVYGDIGLSLTPPPDEMASLLCDSEPYPILIIDNCPPELHRALKERVSRLALKVSVLTIEHEIRQPDESYDNLYILHPSSDAMIQELVQRSHPQLNGLAVSRIARFAGGNARIALWLGASAQHGKDVSTLNDTELLYRILRQGKAEDPALEAAAEVAALVYSFAVDGEPLEGDESCHLAPLAQMGAGQFYRQISRLHNRGLIQERGFYRALLPEAIANRLAVQALKAIPPRFIEQMFNDAPGRLKLSFCHRLNYLGENDRAVQLVKRWFNGGGWLGSASKLDRDEWRMFSYIALLAPSESLALLGKLVTPQSTIDIDSRRFITLTVNALARKTEHFAQAIDLLVHLAKLTYRNRDEREYVLRFVEYLFHFASWGTEAPLVLRLDVARSLLNGPDSWVGERALRGLLELEHFPIYADTLLAAQSPVDTRVPAAREDPEIWIGQTLQLACALALAPGPGAAPARATILAHARSLLRFKQPAHWLQEYFRQLAQTEWWNEARGALIGLLDAPDLNLGDFQQQQLEAAIEVLTPSGIDALIELSINSPDIADKPRRAISGARMARLEQDQRRLAEALLTEPQQLPQFLPAVLSSPNSAGHLGFHLCTGTLLPQHVWQQIVDATPEKGLNLSFIQGFIHGMAHANPTALDELAADFHLQPTLSPYLIHLYFFTYGNAQDVALAVHANLTRIPLTVIAELTYVPDYLEVPQEALHTLIYDIAALPDGLPAALDLLESRLFQASLDHRDCSHWASMAADLLTRYLDDVPAKPCRPFELEATVEVVMCCADSGALARKTITYLLEQGKTKQGSRDVPLRVVVSLIDAHPCLALQMLADAARNNDRQLLERLHSIRQPGIAPFANADPEQLVAWCNTQPDEHYPLLASLLYPWAEVEQDLLHWKPLSLALLDNSPAPAKVLTLFLQLLDRQCFPGPQRNPFKQKAALLDQLNGTSVAALTEYAHYQAKLKRQADEHEKALEGYKRFE